MTTGRVVDRRKFSRWDCGIVPRVAEMLAGFELKGECGFRCFRPRHALFDPKFQHRDVVAGELVLGWHLQIFFGVHHGLQEQAVGWFAGNDSRTILATFQNGGA